MGTARILRSFLGKEEKGVRAIFLLLVLSLLIPTSNNPSAQPNEKVKRAQIIRDTGKPGDYRLLASQNNQVCQHFAGVFARSRSKAGDLDFSKYKEAVRWRQPLEGVALNPPMQVAEFDIDNDGNLDRVFRVRWSVANSPTEDLFVQRLPGSAEPLPSDAAAVEELLKSAEQINISRGDGPGIAALKARYGNDWEKWLILGQISLDVLKFKQTHYVVVWDYEVPANDLARAYVLQTRRDGQSDGVCMFARICPCKGCSPQHGRVEHELSPAKRYCE